MDLLTGLILTIAIYWGSSYVDSTPSQVDNATFSMVKDAVCKDAKDKNITSEGCNND